MQITQRSAGSFVETSVCEGFGDNSPKESLAKAVSIASDSFSKDNCRRAIAKD